MVICEHDFRIDNGGICIGWTGAIGSYVCTKCLATAKYAYSKAGDPVDILWIREINNEYSFINKQAISEFGNKQDRELVNTD